MRDFVTKKIHGVIFWNTTRKVYSYWENDAEVTTSPDLEELKKQYPDAELAPWTMGDASMSYDLLLDEKAEALAVIAAESGTFSDRYRQAREEYDRKLRAAERDSQ